MPKVTYRTGFTDANGREEVLSEYVCDWPDCPNLAEHVVGCAKEIGLTIAVCSEHAERVGIEAHPEQ
jgi:hypothetical protein